MFGLFLVLVHLNVGIHKQKLPAGFPLISILSVQLAVPLRSDLYPLRTVCSNNLLIKKHLLEEDEVGLFNAEWSSNYELKKKQKRWLVVATNDMFGKPV